MANELAYEHGVSLALQMGLANPAANAAAKLTFANGGSGFKVPTGYKFHALALHAEANAALSAGTAVIAVTDNNTALLNSALAVTLDANTQTGSAVMRVGQQPIVAGHVVGAKITADANYSANTVDHDVVIVGVLLPA